MAVAHRFESKARALHNSVMPGQALPKQGGVQHHSHKAWSHHHAQAGLPLPLDLIHFVMTHFVPFLTCT